MALTPDDIANHEFRQTMRGYATTEVDDLLDRLADQVERNERDLAELRQRLEADAAKLAEAQRNEAALTQTLVTAQQTAQRIVQDAEERAAIIIGDAEAQAESLTADAAQAAEATAAEARADAERMRAATAQERVALRARLEQLVTIEQTHRDDLRAHLERQLAALDARDDGPAARALDAGDAALDDSDDGVVDPEVVAELSGTDSATRGWGDLLEATGAAGSSGDDSADDHDGGEGPRDPDEQGDDTQEASGREHGGSVDADAAEHGPVDDGHHAH